jgi:hypothetical protein
MNVGEAYVAFGEMISQFHVIESEQMQDDCCVAKAFKLACSLDHGNYNFANSSSTASINGLRADGPKSN